MSRNLFKIHSESSASTTFPLSPRFRNFRFFTVIVTFRPQGIPHNHIKKFLFPWIMLDAIKILLFLPFQKKPSLCLHALCYINHFAHSHRRRSTFPPSPTGMLPQNHHCSRFMPQGIKKKKYHKTSMCCL